MGEMDVARQAADSLAAIHRSELDAGDSSWAGQVEVLRLAAEATIAHAQGKNDEALEGMRKAADLEDTMDKHPATPGSVLPTRELLGDLLLELGQPSQALLEYEAVLEVAPGRFRSVHGAALAAEKAGDREKARTYYAELDSLAAHAEKQRPALTEAREFLSSR
jgi:tetratricopeptide (TPR) repeat protein